MKVEIIEKDESGKNTLYRVRFSNSSSNFVSHLFRRDLLDLRKQLDEIIVDISPTGTLMGNTDPEEY